MHIEFACEKCGVIRQVPETFAGCVVNCPCGHNFTIPDDDEEGAAATEYAVLLAGVIVLVLLAVFSLGGTANSIFTATGIALTLTPADPPVVLNNFTTEPNTNMLSGFVAGGTIETEVAAMMSNGPVTVTGPGIAGGTTVTGISGGNIMISTTISAMGGGNQGTVTFSN